MVPKLVAGIAALLLAGVHCGGGGSSSSNNNNNNGNNTPPANGFTSADVSGKTIQFATAASATVAEVDSYAFQAGGTVAITSSVLPSSGTWSVGSDGTLTVSYGSKWSKYTAVSKNGPYFVVNSASSDGSSVPNVLWTTTSPFTNALVTNQVVQYTASSGPVMFRFFSNGTVAIVTGGTWLTDGQWSITADGKLAISSGASTVTFSLIQNGDSLAVNYGDGTRAVLNAAVSIIDPAAPVSFQSGMLVGKSLQLHVNNNGTPGTVAYGFNADGSVLITPSTGSPLTGTWAIRPDGSLNIGYGTSWKTFTLVGVYGTFLIVNETDSGGSSASNITLTYVTTSTGFTSDMLSGKTLTAPLQSGSTVSFTFNSDGTMTIAGSGWPSTGTWVVNADGTLTFNLGSGYGWKRFVPIQNTSTVLTVDEIDSGGTFTLEILLSYLSGQSTSVVWVSPSILSWSPPTTGGGYTPIDQVVVAGGNVMKPTSNTWQFTLTYVPEDSSGNPILDPSNNPTVAVTTPPGVYQVKSVTTSCVQPTATQGLALGVILDDSASMATSDPANVRKTAVDTIIDALGSADVMALTDYETNVASPLTDLACWAQQNSATGCAPSASSFISDKTKLHAGAGKINSSGAATPLYEACVEMAGLVSGVTGKQQAILLLSDGQPNGTYSTQQNCLDAANKANVRIYTLGVGPAAEGTSQADTTAVGVLRTLAQQTGGTYAAAAQASSLVSLFSNMETAMQNGSCSSVVTVTSTTTPSSGIQVAGTITFGSTTGSWSFVVP